MVVITQPHSSKQGRLVHRPGTAPIMSLSGRYCSLTDVISSLSGTARLSPFPCTLGWMLFCCQIIQTSPAPCSLSISMIWLPRLAGCRGLRPWVAGKCMPLAREMHSMRSFSVGSRWLPGAHLTCPVLCVSPRRQQEYVRGHGSGKNPEKVRTRGTSQWF